MESVQSLVELMTAIVSSVFSDDVCLQCAVYSGRFPADACRGLVHSVAVPKQEEGPTLDPEGGRLVFDFRYDTIILSLLFCL